MKVKRGTVLASVAPRGDRVLDILPHADKATGGVELDADH